MVLARPGSEPTHYRIRVRGVLDAKWADWFDGFSLQPAQGETILTGTVLDQAALYGILSKIRDLGLPLLALDCQEDDLAGAARVDSSQNLLLQ